jgi:hypothetical protein
MPRTEVDPDVLARRLRSAALSLLGLLDHVADPTAPQTQELPQLSTRKKQRGKKGEPWNPADTVQADGFISWR